MASLVRILLDQISKAVRRHTGGGQDPGCDPSCSDTTTSLVCHNPEHISDWHAHEVHEYYALCNGKQCSWVVPVAGNAFLTAASDERTPICNSNLITPSGLKNWSDGKIKVALFFHCVQPGDYLAALRLHVEPGHSSRIRASISACSNGRGDFNENQCQIPVIHEISIEGGDSRNKIVPLGKFSVSREGYIKLELMGIQRSGPTFADVSHVILIPEKSDGDDGSRQKRSVQLLSASPIPLESESSPSAVPLERSMLKFVSDPGDFYFGRRGPSVHLNYQLDNCNEAGCSCGQTRRTEYFYNEVVVPAGQDVIGSYFCAIGFSGGYFGIQVNSATERRVLFSIWSDYNSDNPKDIPKDFKVELIRKGKDVQVGEFGNEGSGAQSFLKYSWKQGKVYKFLVQGKPLDEEHTMFSAWFLDSEGHESDWKLIASFKKPKVSTYLTGLYSFSENFIPEMGHIERYCVFGNQWAWDAAHRRWEEVTRTRFTADATASKGNRTDVAGGVLPGNSSAFYLRNCGFFSDSVVPGQTFCREKCLSSGPYYVDFSKL